jgi:hypothetical protein
VGGDDGPDDGQAETDAAAAAHPLGAQPAERLEYRGHRLGRHHVAGVLHREGRPRGSVGDQHLHPAAWLVVLDRVGDQVRYEAF